MVVKPLDQNIKRTAIGLVVRDIISIKDLVFTIIHKY